VRRRRLLRVSTVVHLPQDLAARLAAEATRRGVSVDELSAELLNAGLGSSPEVSDGDPLEAFIGSGASGRQDLGRRHRQIRAQLTEGRDSRS
jgi:hypothetical protein